MMTKNDLIFKAMGIVQFVEDVKNDPNMLPSEKKLLLKSKNKEILELKAEMEALYDKKQII